MKSQEFLHLKNANLLFANPPEKSSFLFLLTPEIFLANFTILFYYDYKMKIEKLEYQHFDSTNVLWEIFNKLKAGWAVSKIENKLSEYDDGRNWFKVYFERYGDTDKHNRDI